MAGERFIDAPGLPWTAMAATCCPALAGPPEIVAVTRSDEWSPVRLAEGAPFVRSQPLICARSHGGTSMVEEKVPKAGRDGLRREMLGLGCTLETVAREMIRRWGIRPRAAYRHAHGWSQDEVARRFAVVASRSEVSPVDVGPGPTPPPSTAISGIRIGEYERWPRGGRRPSPETLVLLAAVFGVSVHQLMDYQDLRALPDGDRALFDGRSDGAAPVGGRSPVDLVELLPTVRLRHRPQCIRCPADAPSTLSVIDHY